METFPPAGTEFNEQLRRIVLRIARVSQFEMRVNAPILYPLFRGRRLVLVDADSFKSQSRISGPRLVKVIRQAVLLNGVLLLDL